MIESQKFAELRNLQFFGVMSHLLACIEEMRWFVRGAGSPCCCSELTCLSSVFVLFLCCVSAINLAKSCVSSGISDLLAGE